MNFFVPKTYTLDEAAEVREATRAFLASMGFDTLPASLWKLSAGRPGGARVLKVGAAHPDNGEEVLLILRAAGKPEYYVCTASRGVVAGRPFVIGPSDGRVLAVPFGGRTAV